MAVSANYNQLGKPQKFSDQKPPGFQPKSRYLNKKEQGKQRKKGKGSGFYCVSNSGFFQGSICMSFSIRYLHFKKMDHFQISWCYSLTNRRGCGFSHHLRPNENLPGVSRPGFFPNHSDSFSTPDCRLKKP